jgi:hypothetical protein
MTVASRRQSCHLPSDTARAYSQPRGRVAAKLCTGAAAENGFGEAFWRRWCITVETVSGQPHLPRGLLR